MNYINSFCFVAAALFTETTYCDINIWWNTEFCAILHILPSQLYISEQTWRIRTKKLNSWGRPLPLSVRYWATTRLNTLHWGSSILTSILSWTHNTHWRWIKQCCDLKSNTVTNCVCTTFKMPHCMAQEKRDCIYLPTCGKWKATNNENTSQIMYSSQYPCQSWEPYYPQK